MKITNQTAIILNQHPKLQARETTIEATKSQDNEPEQTESGQNDNQKTTSLLWELQRESLQVESD